MSADDDVPPVWVNGDDARALVARFRAEGAQILSDWTAAIAARMVAGEDVSTGCEDPQRMLARLDQLDVRFKEALGRLKRGESA